MRRLIGPIVLLALVGCVSLSSLPGQALLGYPGLGQQVRLYYERYAWERNIMCASPRMQAITRAELVEQTDTTLLVELRYAWRDESTENGRVFPGCNGFETRRFTIAVDDDGTRVTGMTGEQRPKSPPR